MEDYIMHLDSQEKLAVKRAPIGNITMDDYDFTIEAYCVPEKRITLTKKDCIRKDANSYAFIIETNKLGVGKVIIRMIAQIPDGDFKSGYRQNVDRVCTKYEIRR